VYCIAGGIIVLYFHIGLFISILLFMVCFCLLWFGVFPRFDLGLEEMCLFTTDIVNIASPPPPQALEGKKIKRGCGSGWKESEIHASRCDWHEIS
jgi:hypothetical protein